MKSLETKEAKGFRFVVADDLRGAPTLKSEGQRKTTKSAHILKSAFSFQEKPRTKDDDGVIVLFMGKVCIATTVVC